ncbi:MAG: ribonuclease III [Gammaproteobacteria bacterium]|nr:ribonuclease III [Gammaproteobacteria bacterium]MDE1886925.1 ribonuclease III [Gammaproteobacteria bacterium]MDE2023070.1 ribonuclease III [Gammaproteobacteria bacterium]MDE2139621.1 ribonuclease III [Gammaproteobacteria bacterium]
MSDPLSRLSAAIGYHFHDPQWLTQALTHRSLGNVNNERLEFLGDALLNAVIASELFARHADLDEGAMSRLRAACVNQGALVEIAAGLDLGSCLRLAPGEARSGGLQRQSIQADALEAIIGAVFMDGGWESVRSMIRHLFEARLARSPELAALKDSKTQLQELLQARGLPLPVYVLEKVSGQDHAQTFHVACRLTSPALSASGTAGSRRGAEQEAAGRVLELMQGA